MKKFFKVVWYLFVLAASAALFCHIFLNLQEVYHHRWNQEAYNYMQYEKAEEYLDVDLVSISTSESYTGIIPILVYEKSGISCYNLGQSNKSAMAFLYEVKYAIKTRHPKVVALDFSDLYFDSTPQENEDIYRSSLYILRDEKIKKEYIKEIWKTDPKEALSFQFPLLRFHSMWSAENQDLSPEYDMENVYLDFRQGWNHLSNNLRDAKRSENFHVITPEMWTPDGTKHEISEFSRTYYDIIIEYCQAEGVQVIAVIPPKFEDASKVASEWPTTEQYFIEKGIPYLNYNTYEQAVRMGLDWETDFYNDAHLNYKGAIKWSNFLGYDLAGLGLPDRRLDPASETTGYLNYWLYEFHENYDSLMLE